MILAITVLLQVLIVEWRLLNLVFSTKPLGPSQWVISILLGGFSLVLGGLLRAIPVPKEKRYYDNEEKIEPTAEHHENHLAELEEHQQKSKK